MAISFVQATSTYSSGNLSLTGVGAGNFLVAFASGNGDTDTTAVADSTHSRSFTALTARNGSVKSRIFYLENATGGNTTFALTVGSLSDAGWSVHEYSGIATSLSFDAENWNNYSTAASSWDSNSVSTAQADELLVAIAAEESEPDNFTWTGSFTGRTAQANHVHETADRIVSSTGSYSASGTWPTNYKGAFLISAFKAIAAAGPTGIKTINDTAIASVKTINDTVIASVKTINDAA